MPDPDPSLEPPCATDFQADGDHQELKRRRNYNRFFVSTKVKFVRYDKPVFLVTGAHGFIGAWVAKRLIEADQNVVLFDQDPRPHRLRLIMRDDSIDRAVFASGDITDPSVLPSLIKQHGIDQIIHLAGLQIPSCRANPRLGALVNVVGSINVFEAAAKSNGQVKHIAHASSAGVFGAPVGAGPASESQASGPPRCMESSSVAPKKMPGSTSMNMELAASVYARTPFTALAVTSE